MNAAAVPAKPTPEHGPGHGPAWWARAGIGVLGVAGLVYGAGGLLAHVQGLPLLAVAAWLAVAVLVHDGVLVPLTTAAGGGLSKLGRGLDPVQKGIVRGALLVGALLTLIAAPLLRAQQVLQPHGRGSGSNTTVLPGDYAQALGVFWLVLVLATAAAVAGAGLYGRRAKVRKTRP